MKDWKEVVKTDTRYEDFTILDEPKRFCEMFANQNIPCVQLHSIQTFDIECKQYLVGFCGCFEWKNGKVIPLDGDSYTKNTMVYGYQWFRATETESYLDILVGEEW